MSSADWPKDLPSAMAPAVPQKASRARNLAHCERTMPELRPLGPPPQISASTMATSSEGWRRFSSMAVHMPANPPPTMQTSAVWSPCSAGQSSSSGAIASRSQMQRPSIRVFIGSAGDTQGCAARPDGVVQRCCRPLLQVEQHRHLLAGGMKLVGFALRSSCRYSTDLLPTRLRVVRTRSREPAGTSCLYSMSWRTSAQPMPAFCNSL